MRPEETRSKILAAADALFGETGFDATTTRDISERSGVNKALIHYHFGSKDELLLALLEDYYARLGQRLTAALAKPRDFDEQVQTLLEVYADFLAENRSFARIVQREIASGQHTQWIVERTLPLFQVGVSWLNAELGRSSKAMDAVQLLTTAYGLVVTWFTHGEVLRALTGKDPFSPAALANRKRHVRRVVELLLQELQGVR